MRSFTRSALPTVHGSPRKSPVHAREIALALAQFGGKQGHALDKARVVEPPGINEPKTAIIHQLVKLPLRRTIVADDINIAHDAAVELRLIEHFPPHVLERAYNARTRENASGFPPRHWCPTGG